jgi:hypothetical protein
LTKSDVTVSIGGLISLIRVRLLCSSSVLTFAILIMLPIM